MIGKKRTKKQPSKEKYVPPKVEKVAISRTTKYAMLNAIC
jgi:hypothetical protein